jgi:hypothetical protein
MPAILRNNYTKKDRLQYYVFNEDFFVFKNSYILRSTENVILRRSVINQGPPDPIFTKHHNMHVTSTKFHQNQKINVRSTDRNSFTPLIKVWGFHCVFCHETQSHFVKPLRTPVPNLVQIGRNFRKYRKKANLNCEIRKDFYHTDCYKIRNPSKAFSANILFRISSKSVW